MSCIAGVWDLCPHTNKYQLMIVEIREHLHWVIVHWSLMWVKVCCIFHGIIYLVQHTTLCVLQPILKCGEDMENPQRHRALALVAGEAWYRELVWCFVVNQIGWSRSWRYLQCTHNGLRNISRSDIQCGAPSGWKVQPICLRRRRFAVYTSSEVVSLRAVALCHDIKWR